MINSQCVKEHAKHMCALFEWAVHTHSIKEGKLKKKRNKNYFDIIITNGGSNKRMVLNYLHTHTITTIHCMRVNTNRCFLYYFRCVLVLLLLLLPNEVTFKQTGNLQYTIARHSFYFTFR